MSIHNPTIAEEAEALRLMPPELYSDVYNGRVPMDDAIRQTLAAKFEDADRIVKIRLHDRMRHVFPAKPWTASVVGHSRKIVDAGGMSGATPAEALRALADQFEREGFTK